MFQDEDHVCQSELNQIRDWHEFNPKDIHVNQLLFHEIDDSSLVLHLTMWSCLEYRLNLGTAHLFERMDFCLMSAANLFRIPIILSRLSKQHQGSNIFQEKRNFITQSSRRQWAFSMEFRGNLRNQLKFPIGFWDEYSKSAQIKESNWDFRSGVVSPIGRNNWDRLSDFIELISSFSGELNSMDKPFLSGTNPYHNVPRLNFRSHLIDWMELPQKST
jgi:hypothetical protein